MKTPTKIVVLAALCAVLALALWGVRELRTPNDTLGDLVVENHSPFPVGSVGLFWEKESQVGCRADGALLEEGDYLAFTAERYPVTVTLYRDVEARDALISCVIQEPPSGRWYLILSADSQGEPELIWAHGGQGPEDLEGAAQRQKEGEA